MRICMLTSIFPRSKGDVRGIFIYNNAVALAEAGLEVHVVAPSTEGAADYEILNGVEVHRFRYWFPKKNQKVAYGDGIPGNLKKSILAKIQLPFFLISYLLKSLQVARHCDVIHAQWIQSAYPGLLARSMFGIPVVLSIRGTDIRMLKPGSFLTKMTKAILDRTDMIISLAQEETKLTKALGDYEITEMHNPLDRNAFNSKIPTDLLQKEFGLKNESIITFIGRLSPEKDPLTFIESIPEVVAHIKNVRFFVVGYGSLIEAVKKRVREQNLEKFVIITGLRNDTQLFHALSDIYVSTPTETNLWSNALIEAMASGCACIITDAGETSTCLKHMQEVILVPPRSRKQLSEAMILLLKNRDQIQKLSLNAMKYIENNKFYKEDVVSQLKQIYHDVTM